MSPVMKLQASARPSRVAAARVVARATTEPKGLKPKAGLGLAGASVLLAAGPAAAAPEVDSAVDTVINVVKATGEAVETAINAAATGVEVVKQGYEVAAPVIKQGIEIATPYVNEAVKAAGPVVKQVTPEITKAVTSAIENTGIDLNAVTSTTSTVVKVASEQAAAASPLVTKVVTFLSGQQPTLIAEAAVGFAAIYVITPVLFKGLVGSVRGFAGELTAVKALDVINNEGNVVLVDIRTAREKEASGLPDIASSASSKLVEVEYAFTEDRKLRSQLRDVGAVEAAVTALQVSALKRVNKGTKIVLMCRYGGSAKAVAKELAKRGFGNVFTVANGFDGRGGWVSSKLQIKPAATMYSTTSSSGGSGFSFGTKSKALPAPKA